MNIQKFRHISLVMENLWKRKKMKLIRKNFDKQADTYDERMKKIIPIYDEMLDALVSSIPFSRNDCLDICDLGCGTGNVSKKIKNAFPNSRITCVDMSENMLQTTQKKLTEYNDISYVNSDFYDFSFDKKYDAIVSSLALHHLVSDDDKKMFYQKIFDALKEGGVFSNADVVLGSTDKLHDMYMEKWIAYMKKEFTKEEIEKILDVYYQEDRPAKLLDHIAWLDDIGFKNIDVIWKWYGGAVYGGVK